MKKLLHVVLILTSSICFTQTDELYMQELTTDETGSVYFKQINEIENQTQTDLYLKAKEWFVNSFVSAEHVLQMDDKEAGQLIGKAFTEIQIISIGIPVKIRLHYSIKIATKDNKYLCKIYDLKYQHHDNNGIWLKKKTPIRTAVIDKLYKSNGKVRNINKQYKEETIKAVDLILISLDNSFTKMKEKNSQDEWED